MRRGTACSLVLAAVAATASAQPRPADERLPERAVTRALAVRIVEPTGGVLEVGRRLTVQLTATVSDPRVRTASLTVGGATYAVPVDGGRIEQQLVVVPGNNRVGLVVRRGSQVARDGVTFFARGARAELVVVLSWASAGEIVDLWVREPSGETCKWDHRETTSGGHLLDFSADAIGFGSQAYVLPAVSAGSYRLKVHYWSSRAREDDRARDVHADLLGRLDRVTARLGQTRDAARRRALGAERARIEAQLDRWADPGAPQTAVHAEAVLFPGTPHERRWRLDVVAQRTGQLVTLGEIEVGDEVIRAARGGVAP